VILGSPASELSNVIIKTTKLTHQKRKKKRKDNE
jgi:hypothetical protein